jgi:glycosyltransferase involved in cell wall biosynthesis
MNQQSVTTSCWYCSDETVQGHRDREFNTTVAWDIPILEGYPFRFFKNYSWKASLYNGFFGLFNPGMIGALFREQKSTVIVHGWSKFTYVLVIIAARMAGHTVCIRGESPLNQELLKSKLNRLLKRIVLKDFLFQFVQKFLYIGAQNKAFYEYYGVRKHQLIFVPYAVDNDRFQEAARRLIPIKQALRFSLGLPADASIILFSAKFIQKKRPLDLLAAYEKLQMSNKCLVMVGDGELRPEMESFMKDKGLKRVYLTGFINQTEIVKYYALADVFVLCSEAGETWGLSINEAMNFDLPVVVSSMSGASFDLIEEGRNGYVFNTGDVHQLSVKIAEALQLNGLDGRVIVDRYSYKTILENLKTI